MRNKVIIAITLVISLFLLPHALLSAGGINTFQIQSEDSLPTMFLPVAIVKDRTLYLDKYYDMMITRYPHPDDKKQVFGKTPFYLKKVGEHYLSAFPIVSAIISLPVYFFPLLFNMPVTWENLILLSRISSALIVSLSGLFLYLIGKKFTTEKKALLLTGIYFFATINFATISQALWQHGTLELFTLISLYFFLCKNQNYKNIFYSGLFMGIAILSRPTSALAFIFIFLYTFRKFGTKYTVPYLTGLVPSILFFLFYNQFFYLTISNQGYASQIFENWKTPFFMGFLGLLFSPSKGIFIYSPALIFSAVGSFLTFRNRNENSIFKVFTLIVLLHLLIVGAWKHWYGGWSFGYRMASDVIPYIVLLLIPYVNSKLFVKTKTLFLILVGIAFLIEVMGLVFFDGIWHGAYDRGFKDQSWLWSIENSEIAFYIRRMLFKVGLVKKVI